MKITGTKLGLMLCAVTFISSMAGYISGAPQKQEEIASETLTPQQALAQNISEDSADTPAAELNLNETTKSFVVREHGEKIGLFIKYTNGEEALQQEYAVPVTLLPRTDREELARGIEFSSLSDALQLIEDYSG